MKLLSTVYLFTALSVTATAAEPIRVLIVDGDPGPSLFDSEIFYLMQALQPLTTLRQAMFYPTPVTWIEIHGQNQDNTCWRERIRDPGGQ